MTINDFIANVGRTDFNIETELQVKKYLPIEEKKLIAQGIIYECTEVVDGAVKMDSVQRDLSYVKYMILRHTNLEYTPEDYDALCADGLIDVIMACFNRDAEECRKILDLMLADRMRETSMEYAAAKLLNTLTSAIGSLSEKLNAKVDGIDLNAMIPKDMDTNQLMKFFETYVK